MKTHRGFTLVEAIIVAVIIGILAAVAVPFYQGYSKHYNAKMVNDIAKSAATAANAFYRTYHTDPSFDNLSLFFSESGRCTVIFDGMGNLQAQDRISGNTSAWVQFR